MRNQTRPLIPGIIAVLFFALGAFAETMPIEQVKKGMKGYGLTVFEGKKVEKFDVEILGVLHNVGPDQNLILARVDSPVVRRAGVIAGMSGSPIYVDGKVIGALAYSWQFAKEPVAGITPIDEMLKIARSGGSAAVLPAAMPRMTGAEFLRTLSSGKAEEGFAKMLDGLSQRQRASVGGAMRISVPLSLSSFSSETVTRFSPWLESMGFMAVPSGTTAAGQTASTVSPAKPFAPGDPVGAVLLSGDFNVAATGTVTHIDGDRVYAFGHPFLDMGEISFPMAEAEIVDVLPNLASSFKFSNGGRIVGALKQDRAAGIMGIVGEHSPMIPVSLTVDGSGIHKIYNVNVARHPQLSPLMLAMAADSVIANVQRAAGERTIVLESEIKLKGMDAIRLREGWAGQQARAAIPAYMALITGYLVSNEFQPAEIESVKVRIRHDDDLRYARLLEASLVPPPAGRIEPGDKVQVRAVLKPFRGETFVETFDVTIPADQPVGSAYLLVGSGSVANAVDFALVPPDPRNLEQVVNVLHRLRPSTDLTVGLYSPSDGAVAAGVYLPQLPPSMRAVVSGDTSNAAQAPVKYHSAARQARSLEYVVDGVLKIDIDVRPQI